jgi:hypothetical protein
VRDIERHAPLPGGDDLLAPSTGEVGIRSGRSGPGGGREAEHQDDGEQNAAAHQRFFAFSIAPSTSSHIPPVTAVTKFPFAS